MFQKRCPICDWPMAEVRDDGCVDGDCSYRPREWSEEWFRITARRAKLAAEAVQKDARVDQADLQRKVTI